jgi:5-methylcytosine-specific restriction endonuclease McrA
MRAVLKNLRMWCCWYSYNGTCWFCEEVIDGIIDGTTAGEGKGAKRKRSSTGGTIDHLIPFCVGGPSSKENAVPACEDCNQRKASWWLDHLKLHEGGGFDVPDIDIQHLNEFNARVGLWPTAHAWLSL